MSGSATLATARLRFATAATRIRPQRTRPACSGAVDRSAGRFWVNRAVVLAGSVVAMPVGHQPSYPGASPVADDAGPGCSGKRQGSGALFDTPAVGDKPVDDQDVEREQRERPERVGRDP